MYPSNLGAVILDSYVWYKTFQITKMLRSASYKWSYVRAHSCYMYVLEYLLKEHANDFIVV